MAKSSRSLGPRRLLAVTALALTTLLAACSTTDARIKRNQDLFDSLPAERQTLIREGKVGLGFTPDMVRLALGDPDQRWERTDAQGESESWSYTTYDSTLGRPFYRGYYHRYSLGYPIYDAGFHAQEARPREYLKVVFAAGVVAEIVQEKR